jgi:hypothetical protein
VDQKKLCDDSITDSIDRRNPVTPLLDCGDSSPLSFLFFLWNIALSDKEEEMKAVIHHRSPKD